MLVCCDNEGCIVDAKGQRFDLPALHDLAADIAAFPGAFTICTGRAVPYVEAIVQVLGLVGAATPCVCEGGGVFYTPSEDRHEAIAGRVDSDAVRALPPAGSYALLDRTGWDWPDVLAIGDSWNDLPMLGAARLSACPANAVPEVKAVVDYVSPLPATRGVADILRWAAAPPAALVN